jgi:CheY-like chemotaxis protein
MQRIQLVHWNTDEAETRAARLRAAGYEVACDRPNGPPFLRRLKENPPAAVVIDLSRLPSQGRDIAQSIRVAKATRGIPIVFVDGAADKVAPIREQLPDAAYTTWSRIRSALKQAIAHPPAQPVAPRSVFDVYAGRPLAQKLGIRAGSTVALLDAPPGFAAVLAPLPDGVQVVADIADKRDVALWFVRSRLDLESRFEEFAAWDGLKALWIVWPKRASGVDTDLSQPVVRERGLAAGLVDYKVCSVDATWTGLCFARRAQRGARAA